MKRVRLGSLFVIAVLVVLRPMLVGANHNGVPHACCPTAYDYCNLTICEDHGGALLCDTHIGGSCGDMCYCADGYRKDDFSGGVCGSCS